MNAIVCKVVMFTLKKYKEPSTWIPLVSAAGLYLHREISPELQTAVAFVFSSIVAALFVAINERTGPNPSNAPKPPDGTAQLATPVEPGIATVVVHNTDPEATAVPSHGNDAVRAGDRPAVRSTTLDDGESQREPVRSGFGKQFP
jgi:hypothetical protein